MPGSNDSLDEVLQRAYRYALALTHDADLAQDLVQDACLAVSRRGGPWHAGYLVTAVRNRYIDDYRRRQAVLFEPLGEAEQVADAKRNGAFSEEPMEAILALLKPTERELLYLSAVEDYSASEIARLTGRPRGTVLSALHRAKKKLRRLLSGPLGRQLL